MARRARKVGPRIREAFHSRAVAKTTRKYGKAAGRKQAVAIGFAKMRRAAARKRRR